MAYKVGNGKQRLSLCNIKNIYEAVNYIINNCNKEKNKIYNVSDKKVYEFNDLLKFIIVKTIRLFFQNLHLSQCFT